MSKRACSKSLVLVLCQVLVLTGLLSRSCSAQSTKNAPTTKERAQDRRPPRHNFEVQNRPRSAVEVKVEAELKKPTSFKFQSVKLGEALASLSKAHNIPIRLNADIDKNAFVTCEVKDLTLASGLALMFMSLTDDPLFTIQDELGLRVTNWAAASERREKRVYNIQPLKLRRSQELSDLVVEQISGPWQEVDGEGGKISVDEGTAVILQSQRGHREVHELFEMMLQHVNTVPGETPRILVQRRPASDQELLIEKVLQQPAKIDFHKVPLDEAVKTIREKYQLPLFLDEHGLNRAGVNTDVEVSVQSQAEDTVHTVLARLVKGVDSGELTTTIWHELLFVTSMRETEHSHDVRLYDVRSLQAKNPQSLLDNLQKNVPGPWQEVNGEGGVATTWAGSILIRHSPIVHDRVLNWLEKQLELKIKK